MTSKTIKIVLIASLAMNLLVVAAVGTAVIRSDRPDFQHQPRTGGETRRFGRSGPPEIGALARGLDREGRAALRDRLRADTTLRTGREQMAEKRADVLSALRAEPYDPDALTEALSGQRALQTELAERGFAAIAEVVEGLSYAERIAFADRVEAATSRGGRPRR